MNKKTFNTIIGATIYCISTSLLAATDCSKVLEISKVTKSEIGQKNQFETQARAFCDEYSSNKNKKVDWSLSTSYKIFSASTSGSYSNAESLATKYCDSSNSSKTSASAYDNYIESIAPEAYNAYKQCLNTSKEVIYQIDPIKILPKTFSLNISYTPKRRGSTTIYYNTSQGITCKWNKDSSKDYQNSINLFPGATTTLTCNRDNFSEDGYIDLVREDSSNTDDNVTIPWKAYSKDGTKISDLLSLNRKIEKIQSNISNSKIETGTVLLQPTSDANKDSACNGEKGNLNGYHKFKTPFLSVPKVNAGITRIDSYPNKQTRLDFTINEITKDGFKYKFYSWCDSKVFSATVSYIAISDFDNK